MQQSKVNRGARQALPACLPHLTVLCSGGRHLLNIFNKMPPRRSHAIGQLLDAYPG